MSEQNKIKLAELFGMVMIRALNFEFNIRYAIEIDETLKKNKNKEDAKI